MKAALEIMTQTDFIKDLRDNPESLYRALLRPRRSSRNYHPDSQEAMESQFLDTATEWAAGRVWGNLTEDLRARFLDIVRRADARNAPWCTKSQIEDSIKDLKRLCEDTMPIHFPEDDEDEEDFFEPTL